MAFNLQISLILKSDIELLFWFMFIFTGKDNQKQTHSKQISVSILSGGNGRTYSLPDFEELTQMITFADRKALSVAIKPAFCYRFVTHT